MKLSRAVSYRVTTMVCTGALAAFAFVLGTEGWDIVGAVLLGVAIVDAILLVVVAWFHWRHRHDSAG